MMREIRMANFGSISDVLALPDLGNGRGVNGFTEEVKPEGTNKITIVGGFRQIRQDNGDPITVDSASGTQVTLNYATNAFDGAKHKFISIGGIESNTVQSTDGAKLTLDNPLKLSHPMGTPIFKILAITYDLGLSDGKLVLRRDENTGGHPQPLAENIENVQFEYFDANGNPSTIPANIRMVKVTITARTSMSDPEFKGGTGGFRRRTITSNIHVRNMGLNP
jgi:hypothetical protein